MGINKGYLEAKTDKASDEVYTPAYAVKPIIKYIDRGNKEFYTIWCPFDKEDSEFVKLIRTDGHKVIASHIDDGKTFLLMNQKSHMTILFLTRLLVLKMIYSNIYMN